MTVWHVDHDTPSFANIVNGFLKKTKKPMPVAYESSQSSYISNFKPEDSEYEKEFVEYHNRVCKLQMLCKNCNLRKEREKLPE
jgi:hypothetical protein